MSASPASVPQRLLDDAKKGDQKSFNEIFRVYQPLLMRYLRTVAPALASDVDAATWESVARSFHKFEGDSDGFRGWLFTIARRRLVDEVRKSSRRHLGAVAPVETPDSRTAADAGYTEVDWAESVLQAIPTRQADAVALRVIGGLSVEETADLLGVSPGNVRVLCHRGLQAIQAVLADGQVAEVDIDRLSERFLSVV